MLLSGASCCRHWLLCPYAALIASQPSPTTCWPWPPSPQNPEDVDWAACATGVEELVLWLKAYALEGPPPAEYTVDTLNWVRWAADRPRLRLVELWVGDESELRHNDLLRWAARAEGEDVEDMLGRFLMAVADALVHPGY